MRPALLALLLTACARADPPPAPLPSPCAEQRFEQAGSSSAAPTRSRFTRARAASPPSRRASAPGPTALPSHERGMFDDAGAPIGLMIEQGKQVHAINRRAAGAISPPPQRCLPRAQGRKASVVTRPHSRRPGHRLRHQSARCSSSTASFIPVRCRRHLALRSQRGRIAPTASPSSSSPPMSSRSASSRAFPRPIRREGCALLDGSVSSLWDPANGRMDDFVELGPLIVAFRNAASAPGRASPATP